MGLAFSKDNYGFKCGATGRRAENRPGALRAEASGLSASVEHCPAGAARKSSSELFALDLPARAECLGTARHAVADVAGQLHLNTEDTCDLLLAVGEACNNALLHGSGAASGSLQIRCRLNCAGAIRPVRALQIDVTNAGNGFLPKKGDKVFSMPKAEDLTGHGRGLPLMRQLMDDVQVICENGNTVVRLTKKIPV